MDFATYEVLEVTSHKLLFTRIKNVWIVCGKGRDAGAFSRQKITSVALRASSSNGRHSFTFTDYKEAKQTDI